MSHVIGISCGHGEKVHPQAESYSMFFEMLRAQGRRTQPIEMFTPQSLAGCNAILIGDSQIPFESCELVALDNWLKKGGHLLAFCGNTLDTADQVFTHDTWGVGAEGVFAQEDADENLVASVPWDVSSLTVRPATVLFFNGSAVSYYEEQRGAIELKLEPDDERYPAQLPGLVKEWKTEDGQLKATHTFTADDTELLLYVQARREQGSEIFFTSPESFSNNILPEFDNLLFLNWLFAQWLPGLIEENTRQRMSQPQRHRLLHGYPMTPTLVTATAEEAQRHEQWEAEQAAISKRPVTVGVLPHPFCNPTVKGCGFCTFPHELFSGAKASTVVENVLLEIDRLMRIAPGHALRRVKGLYFGGGTANLTPASAFRSLCQKLENTFDLHEAEVTLEGVPGYFIKRQPLLVDVLQEELTARHFRLSMGVQTFDESQLQKMGRIGYGNGDTFREVIRWAHSRELTISADMLINLPGQSLQQMKDDITQAVESELDQICLYHLVLFDGIGTEWSRDPQLLASLPGNEEACSNWLILREQLLASGFVQTTLTNFERRESNQTSRRFLYEEYGYCPEEHDLLGFGPTGNSLTVDPEFRTAMKRRNPEAAEEYVGRVQAGGAVWSRMFEYTHWDLRLMYLSRKVVMLNIDRGEYHKLFGTNVARDFRQEWNALEDAGLVSITDENISLSPKGMFYADTISGLLAARQIQLIRAQRHATTGESLEPITLNGDSNRYGHM